MPSGLPSGLPTGIATDINLGPSPITTSFSGDFLGLSIPDDDQLWGLSPVSPMATGWDKADSAAFANSALERDLKNAQVRNGQPTPPPYDDQGRDLSGIDVMETASKRRRVREYKTAAASLSPDLDDAPPHDRAKRAKFLERNRLAASKCRQKKKEHTQKLEIDYKEQSDKKEQLMAEISRLRSEVLGLKNEVLKHAQCGDEPIKLHLAHMVKKITDGDVPQPVLPKSSPAPLPDNGSVSPMDPTPVPETSAAVPASAPAPSSLSFGFDDPLPLEPAAAAAAEAFEQQMRRESEASLVSEGSYSFSAEDASFDDLINV
jgi:hypothetical protein